MWVMTQPFPSYIEEILCGLTTFPLPNSFLPKYQLLKYQLSEFQLSKCQLPKMSTPKMSTPKILISYKTI